MTLAVFIGDGPVGQLMAQRAKQIAPDAHYFTISNAEEKVRKQIPQVTRVGLYKFRELLAALRAKQTSEVIFAGNFFYQNYSPELDDLGRAYIPPATERWYPHVYLNAMQNFLLDSDIKLRSIFDLLPELRQPTELRSTATSDIDPRRCLSIATAFMKGQRWQTLRQYCIVGQFDVVRFDSFPRVDLLIEAFGVSSHGATAQSPTLCCFSVGPFGLIAPPAVGPGTLWKCRTSGIKAVVVDAATTIVLNREEVLRFSSEESVRFYAV
jgi:DUF1009 family protein